MHHRLHLSFALLAFTSMLACGDADEPVGEQTSSDVRSTTTHADAGEAFLGFAPLEGVTETPITLEFAVADACNDASCTVTIDGYEAAFVDESRSAVLVPRLAKRGPEGGLICVTSAAFESCLPGLTVLERPLVDDVTVVPGANGPTVVVHGVGFPQDGILVVGYERIETTFVSPFELTGIVPKAFGSGTHDVTVLAPSHGRCGTPSAPVAVSLDGTSE
jgi:hypothetical protein